MEEEAVLGRPESHVERASRGFINKTRIKLVRTSSRVPVTLSWEEEEHFSAFQGNFMP